jgi:imidazole glycerol phosphate synthase glutamine amidotransferase subunit
MIALVDYGAGNLHSVANALDAAGADYRIVTGVEGLKEADKIILPGVGHFGQMMRSLTRLDLCAPLQEKVRKGIPLLGICLGFQALFSASEEAPGIKGLCLLDGEVKRFQTRLRVPHMGWNTLSHLQERECRMLGGIGAEPYVYFAHSFYAPLMPATAAACTYEEPFTAIAEVDNLFGVQFHPEKSGQLGIRILKNFLEL